MQQDYYYYDVMSGSFAGNIGLFYIPVPLRAKPLRREALEAKEPFLFHFSFFFYLLLAREAPEEGGFGSQLLGLLRQFVGRRGRG